MRRATPHQQPPKRRKWARIEAPAKWPDDFPVIGGDEVYRRFDVIDHLHVHDSLEIGICLRGSGVLVVENRVFAFHPGNVSIINNREYHMRRSLKGTSTDWAYIHVDPSRLLRNTAPEPELLDVGRLEGPAFANIIEEEDHPEIVRTVRQLREELLDKPKGYRTAVRGLVGLLLAQLHRRPGVRSAPGAALPPGRFTGRVAQAMQHMANHLAEPLSMEKLAREVCHVSLTHLQRLFHEAGGDTPRAFLIQLRVRAAAALLQATDRTVLDIALETGHPSVSSLNRNFRAMMGLSPREWRQESRHRYQTPDGDGGVGALR